MCSADVVLDVKSAVNNVCSASAEYDKHGDALLDNLIDACTHCMCVLSSLLREVAGLVDANSKLCK
jgi:hypothetical protein